MSVILSIFLYLLISGPFANLLNNFLKPREKTPEADIIYNKTDKIVIEKVVCYNNDNGVILSSYDKK